jgi:hypothetical protein
MSSPATPPPESTGVPPLSEAQRIINVFVAPRQTFTDIRRSARWWVAWLFTAIFSLAFSFTIAQQIGWQQIQETQIRIGPESRREQIEKLPPEQRAQQMRFGLMITKAIGYGYPVFNLIALLVMALVLWGTFSFGAGADVRFGQTMAIVVYASLPSIVRAVLGIVVVMAGVDPENYIIQNPVGTNLGYYLDITTTPRFLYSLATSVDLISLWVLWLTAVGFMCVAKVKKGTAYGLVFGWWAVVSLAFAGLAAIFAG